MNCIARDGAGWPQTAGCSAAVTRHSNMICIPGRTFRMGSDRHYPEEGPVHRVTVDGSHRSSRTPKITLVRCRTC